MKKNQKKSRKHTFSLKNKKYFLILGVTLLLIGIFFIIININKNNNNKEECKIIFDSNGGEPIDELVFNCGTVVKAPNKIPIKEGFIFTEWTYMNEPYYFNEKITKDMVVSANYISMSGVNVVSVYFNTDGGTYISPIEIVKGKSLTPPISPTKYGFDFQGWYLENKKFDFKQGIEENITLKAKWTKSNDKQLPSNVHITSSDYKCFASYSKELQNREINIETNKNFSEIFYTMLVYSTNDCSISYKSSNSSIATISEEGIITPVKDGNVYVYQCINDSETKQEVGCFKGNLTIKKAINITNTSSNYKKYDEIASKYNGKWYLEGYSDITLIVEKSNLYDGLDLNTINLDWSTGTKYPKYDYGSGGVILYDRWDERIKLYNVKFGDEYIKMTFGNQEMKFIKQKGTKDKYTGTFYKEAVGVWYLNNYPDSSLSIFVFSKSTDETNYDIYCLEYNNFNLNTLEQTGSGRFECSSGGEGPESMYKRLGITLTNGVLKVTNNNGTKLFYKTKTSIDIKSLTLNKNNLELTVGDSYKLQTTVSPSNATYKNIKWKSDDQSIVSVTSDGVITAKNIGTTIVTATSQDGTHSVKCIIEVKPILVNGITLNQTSLEIIKGTTKTIEAILEPKNATNKKVIWTTDNSDVAEVELNGKVVAKSKGTAIITAKTEDGNHLAYCNVHVINPKLKASASFNSSSISVSGEQTIKKVGVTVNATGGTGIYKYSIEFYKDNILVEKVTDAVTNGISIKTSGVSSYFAKFTVTDSDGATYSGTIDPTNI